MKLLFISNVASFFLSHRLPIALSARSRGWWIALVSGHEVNKGLALRSSTELQILGISLHPASFAAAGVNPFAELIGLFSVIHHVRAIKPDIVHTASPKGNLYGGIAARLCRVPKLVVAVSGQGFLFTGKRTGWKAVLANLYLRLIRWVYAHPDCTVIVQNRDDWNALVQQGLAKASQLVLIPGSGVDLGQFDAAAVSVPEPIILLPARLLTDKGVLEFVQAARRLKEQAGDWRFVLVGEADGANPAAITSAQVHAWVEEGIIEWWGHRADMPAVFSQAAIVCLPSYREGMPKVLLEAAAAARPVITTDTIGCREAIVDGETGILVPVQDADALAAAIMKLIEDPALRQRMGRAGRERAEREFDIRQVVARHMAIYGIDAPH